MPIRFMADTGLISRPPGLVCAPNPSGVTIGQSVSEVESNPESLTPYLSYVQWSTRQPCY